MATSVFLGNSSSSDLENTRSKEMEISLMNGSGEKPIRVPAGKPNGGGGGRKKAKVNESTQKKPRQRGMGVEQLERLRFQERIKKMTEINPIHPLSFQNQQFTTLPTTPGFGAYSILNGGGGGVGPVGFDVQQSALFSDQESKFLAPVDHPFVVGSGFRGTELSSIPNHLKWSSECGVCYKKFRGNGENLMCNGERKMCGSEMSGFGNFGNVVNKAAGSMFNGGNPYYSASKPTGQEVEVMAVHRKGLNTGCGGGGSVLMEYEFFPGKAGGNYCNYKEIINMASSSSSDHNHQQDFIHGVGLAGGAGGGAGSGYNDAIDLSLKLSY